MFVRSISDAAHRVAQRVVAAIFLLLPASRLPPLLRVLCSPTCGTSDGSRSIDGRKFERFKKWPLRFGFFLSRGIWKRRSRITRITETDRLLFEAIVTVIEEMMILEELFLRFTSTIR